ncbi:MAG TPA: hypothetical protein VEI02_02530 [Planctomycetota bacterium]|nr:hypothetical protein [Planctomycetota bacterium]
MTYTMTRHRSDEAPPISGDGLEIIDLLANADAEAPDEDGMPRFGRAADGTIWAVDDASGKAWRWATA